MNISAAPAKWLETLARLGLSAKGAVYCISGILAFMAAFEIGNATEKDAGRQGIFKTIGEQPFGMVLIGMIALGLVFFCIWRFIEAIKDTEHKGSDAKGLGKRAAYLASGIMYSGMALYAIRFLFHSQQQGSGGKQQQMVQDVLNKPFGEWLLIIFALIIVATGIYQLYYGLSGKYKKHVEQSKIEPNTKKVLLRAGKVGYMSRGIVWLIIAWLFAKAAFHHNAKEAGGNDSAFKWLETSSYGSFMLAAVATGLICYGIFMFVRARHQPIGH